MAKANVEAQRPVDRLDVLQGELDDARTEFNNRVEKLSTLIGAEIELRNMERGRRTNGHSSAVVPSEKVKRQRKTKEVAANQEEDDTPPPVDPSVKRWVNKQFKEDSSGRTLKEFVAAAKAAGREYSSSTLKAGLKALAGDGKVTLSADKKWTPT